MRPQRGSRRDVDDRGQDVLHAARARLARRHGEDLLEQLGIERRRQADRLREAGAAGATKPCSDSSCNSAGIPSRVFSTRNFWIALAKATAPCASWRSLGRVISPMPSGISFSADAGDSSCVFGSSMAFLSQLTLPSWATFSASVIRLSRSATRLSTESFGSRYGAPAVVAAAALRRGAGQVTAAPHQTKSARLAVSNTFATSDAGSSAQTIPQPRSAAALPEGANWLTCRPMRRNVAAQIALVSLCLSASASVIPSATSPSARRGARRAARQRRPHPRPPPLPRPPSPTRTASPACRASICSAALESPRSSSRARCRRSTSRQ